MSNFTSHKTKRYVKRIPVDYESLHCAKCGHIRREHREINRDAGECMHQNCYCDDFSVY
jgi:hypothetical protein